MHSSTVRNNQDMEATSMAIDRGVDKEDVVCIHNRILLSHKKERNNGICSNMDAARDYHSNWSKSEKDKHRITSLICGI